MKILAFDPANGCTGWAVLEDNGAPDGVLLARWVILNKVGRAVA